MKKYKFKAAIQEGRGGGAFVFFPFNVEREFGTDGKIPINATFDTLPYKGSLIKYGYAQHMLGVPKAIREQAGKNVGETMEVVVWKDEAERVIEVPPELQKLMEQEKLLPFFEKLSYTHRKEYCRWIREAKKDDTRARRLAKAIELMKKGVKTPS